MNRLSRYENCNWQILKKQDLTLINQKAKNIKIYEKIIEFHMNILGIIYGKYPAVQALIMANSFILLHDLTYLSCI